jgi:hypothetical protein
MFLYKSRAAPCVEDTTQKYEPSVTPPFAVSVTLAPVRSVAPAATISALEMTLVPVKFEPAVVTLGVPEIEPLAMTICTTAFVPPPEEAMVTL